MDRPIRQILIPWKARDKALSLSERMIDRASLNVSNAFNRISIRPRHTYKFVRIVSFHPSRQRFYFSLPSFRPFPPLIFPTFFFFLHPCKIFRFRSCFWKEESKFRREKILVARKGRFDFCEDKESEQHGRIPPSRSSTAAATYFRSLSTSRGISTHPNRTSWPASLNIVGRPALLQPVSRRLELPLTVSRDQKEERGKGVSSTWNTWNFGNLPLKR